MRKHDVQVSSKDQKKIQLLDECISQEDDCCTQGQKYRGKAAGSQTCWGCREKGRMLEENKSRSGRES
jgi:hypothetical protein